VKKTESSEHNQPSASLRRLRADAAMCALGIYELRQHPAEILLLRGHAEYRSGRLFCGGIVRSRLDQHCDPSPMIRSVIAVRVGMHNLRCIDALSYRG
jgi:hypothetical protein